MKTDEPSNLGTQLDALKPAAPSEELMRRLRAARTQVRLPMATDEPLLAERLLAWWKEWWWVPSGATAVAAGLLFLSARELTETSQTVLNMPAGAVRRVFVPEQVDNFLVDAQDLGVFVDESSRPFKLFRATWVDTANFRGDDGESRMLVTDSRQTFIPVALQFY